MKSVSPKISLLWSRPVLVMQRLGSPPPPLLQKKKKKKGKVTIWSLEVWILKNSSLDFSRYSNFDIGSLSRNSCSGIVSLLVIPKLLHIPLSNYQKNNLFFISQIENTHQVSGDMI